MRFEFRYRGKLVRMEVNVCKSIFSKFKGLMFSSRTNALLFVFPKAVSISIHSFFCKPFYAIWLYKGEVVDEKYVRPWRWNIKPKKRFDSILEIPLGNPYFNYFLNRR